MYRPLWTGPALVLACLLLSGCFYSREVARTRHAIEQAYPEARFDREMVLSLGPVSLFTAGLLTGLASDETEDVRPYLRYLRRVKVGVYAVEGLPPLDAVDLPQLRRLREKGWETLIATREEDATTWTLYRERRGTVRDVYVLTLSEDELVMVRLKGRLDKLLAHAMRENGELDLSEFRVSER